MPETRDDRLKKVNAYGIDKVLFNYANAIYSFIKYEDVLYIFFYFNKWCYEPLFMLNNYCKI